VNSPTSFRERVLSEPFSKLIVKRLLKKGVHEDDAPDLCQEVVIKLLAVENPPEPEDECEALAMKIAKNQASDYRRKNKRRGRYNTGLTDQEDEHSRGGDLEPDAYRKMENEERADIWTDLVEGGEIAPDEARIVMLDAQGVPDADIARRMKIAVQTVRNKLSRVHKILADALEEKQRVVVGGVVIILTIFALVWVAQRNERVAHHHEHDILPDTTKHLEQPSPQEMAQFLRDKARTEIEEGNLDGCEADLDEAKRLDPAGERSEDVQRMRAFIEDVRHPPQEGKKPGDRPQGGRH
jgi:RNA polymerase sigma factor (sigma-70 family)